MTSIGSFPSSLMCNYPPKADLRRLVTNWNVSIEFSWYLCASTDVFLYQEHA